MAGLKDDLYEKREGLGRLEIEKRRKFDCIDDFLRENFEMVIKMSSENTPFLNRYVLSIAYSLFVLKKKTLFKNLTN